MTTTENANFHHQRRDSRSTPALLADLASQLSSLFGKEVELARTELSEKVTQSVAGLGFMIAAAVFLIGAVNVLFAALVAALVEAGIEAPWASVVVAAGAAIVGLLFALKGISNLKTSNLTPQRTADQVKRDAALIKEHLQ